MALQRVRNKITILALAIFLLGLGMNIVLAFGPNVVTPDVSRILVWVGFGLIVLAMLLFIYGIFKTPTHLNIELIDMKVSVHNLGVLENGQMKQVFGTPMMAKVFFENKPLSQSQKLDAPNVSGNIEIKDENGNSLFPAMKARWANSNEPVRGGLRTDAEQHTLSPNGTSEPMLIALKYTGDEVAYGLNWDNLEVDPQLWRDCKKKIPIGTYLVKIHLNGVSVDRDREYEMTLTNLGVGQDIRIS